jgi:hypothetical protein
MNASLDYSYKQCLPKEGIRKGYAYGLKSEAKATPSNEGDPSSGLLGKTDLFSAVSGETSARQAMTRSIK